MDMGSTQCLCSAAVADWVQGMSESMAWIFISMGILSTNKQNGSDDEALTGFTL